MHGGHRDGGCSLTGGVQPTLRQGGRRSGGCRPGSFCSISGGPSELNLKRWCARPSRSLGGIRCTCATISLRLMRPGPSGSCSVDAHLVFAHQPLQACCHDTHPCKDAWSSAGDNVCSDASISSAFAHDMPGLASHHLQTLLILMRSRCRMFRHMVYIMLSSRLTFVMQTLHLMPCHCKMRLQAMWRSCGTTRLAERRASSTRCLSTGAQPSWTCLLGS